MKRFREYVCVFCNNPDSDFPNYEDEPCMIDLNSIVAFNKGDNNTTTVRFAGGETLRVKMKYVDFSRSVMTERIMN